MFQVRTPSGQAYNPVRDIVNLFPRLAASTATNLAPPFWHQALRAKAEALDINNAAMCEAAKVLAEFLNVVTKHECPSFEAAWIKAGGDKLTPGTIVAMFATLGLVTMGTYFNMGRASAYYGVTTPGADQAGTAIEETIHGIKKLHL